MGCNSETGHCCNLATNAVQKSQRIIRTRHAISKSKKGKRGGRVNTQRLQETNLGKRRSDRTLALLSTHPTDSYPIYSMLTAFTQQPIEYIGQPSQGRRLEGPKKLGKQ